MDMLVTVGLPVPNLDARLESVPEMGYSLLSGYFKRDDLTNEVVVDGWLHTGLIERAETSLEDHSLAIKRASGFVVACGSKGNTRTIIVASRLTIKQTHVGAVTISEFICGRDVAEFTYLVLRVIKLYGGKEPLGNEGKKSRFSRKHDLDAIKKMPMQHLSSSSLLDFKVTHETLLPSWVL